MNGALDLLLIGLTLGLPFWFALLDQKSLPRLRWIGEGDPPPLWGRLVVLVGIGLAVVITMAAPLSSFPPTH